MTSNLKDCEMLWKESKTIFGSLIVVTILIKSFRLAKMELIKMIEYSECNQTVKSVSRLIVNDLEKNRDNITAEQQKKVSTEN